MVYNRRKVIVGGDRLPASDPGPAWTQDTNRQRSMLGRRNAPRSCTLSDSIAEKSRTLKSNRQGLASELLAYQIPSALNGAFERGGRYNAPHTFPVLYSAGSPVTALREAEVSLMTADGQLHGVARDPELILTLECTLLRVLDLTVSEPR